MERKKTITETKLKKAEYIRSKFYIKTKQQIKVNLLTKLKYHWCRLHLQDRLRFESNDANCCGHATCTQHRCSAQWCIKSGDRKCFDFPRSTPHTFTYATTKSSFLKSTLTLTHNISQSITCCHSRFLLRFTLLDNNDKVYTNRTIFKSL